MEVVRQLWCVDESEDASCSDFWKYGTGTVPTSMEMRRRLKTERERERGEERERETEVVGRSSSLPSWPAAAVAAQERYSRYISTRNKPPIIVCAKSRPKFGYVDHISVLHRNVGDKIGDKI